MRMHDAWQGKSAVVKHELMTSAGSAHGLEPHDIPGAACHLLHVNNACS